MFMAKLPKRIVSNDRTHAVGNQQDWAIYFSSSPERDFEHAARMLGNIIFVARITTQIPQVYFGALTDQMRNQKRQPVAEFINPAREPPRPRVGLGDIPCVRLGLGNHCLDCCLVDVEIAMPAIEVISPRDDIEAADTGFNVFCNRCVNAPHSCKQAAQQCVAMYLWFRFWQ